MKKSPPLSVLPTYHSIGLDSKIPLDNGRHQWTPKEPLGLFDTLSQELLDMILPQLDIRTLTNLRMANKRGREVVDSTPQYRTIFERAAIAIRVALTIEMGEWLTCQALYDAIMANECGNCGNEKNPWFLWLLTPERVCLHCLTQTYNLDYLPLTEYDIRDFFQINPKDPNVRKHLRSFRCLRSMSFLHGNRLNNRRTTFFDHRTAKAAAIAYHGDEDKMWEEVTQGLRRQDLHVRLGSLPNGIPSPQDHHMVWIGQEPYTRRMLAAVRVLPPRSVDNLQNEPDESFVLYGSSRYERYERSERSEIQCSYSVFSIERCIWS
jgi:hypothetical protein